MRTVKEECQRFREIFEILRLLDMDGAVRLQYERASTGFSIPDSIMDAVDDLGRLIKSPSKVWKPGEKKKFIQKIIRATEEARKPFDLKYLRDKVANSSNLSVGEVMELYGIDKGEFSRVINNKQECSKELGIKMIFAAKLSLEDARDFNALYGNSFNLRDERDALLFTCLVENIYDPLTIDDMLYEVGLKTFFSRESAPNTEKESSR